MISVVIPAYNEEKHIVRCLDAFVAQQTTYPFEVILVNNNSTDNTEKLAKEYQSKITLHIILEKEKGRGHARATGFAKAKGDVILSTDADAIAPNDWIEQMGKVFEESSVGAVTGTGRMIDASTFKNTLATYLLPYVMHFYALLHHHYWLTGFNFGIRKSIYLQSGGFRQINGLEDIDLGFRVYKLGKIKYKPIWVYMSGRRFDKSVLQGVYSYLTGYIDYRVKKKPDIYLSDIRN